MRSRFPSPGVLFSVALPLFCLSCRPQKPVAAGEVPPVILSDPGGGEHRLFVPDSGTKATVAIFLMTDCPVARAMLPDLNEMAKRYSPLGIHFYGVFADEDPESILRHIGDYRIAFPCLMDDACQLAKISGARRVPEAAIFGPDGIPLYRGRIDDRAVKIGRIKPVPAERNLSGALDALLAGKNLPSPKPVTAGCYLPLD
jgi:hypothetical protein